MRRDCVNTTLIQKPRYFKEEYIYSVDLRKALASTDLLKYLRDLFNEDAYKFYDLRDEMILRGFEFSVDSNKNLFPALLFQPETIIVVNKNLELYKKITPGVTGIENLIRHYIVTNDYFFNYVSIEAISSFLKKDVEFIKMQFIQAGFQIVSSAEVPLVDKNEADVMGTTFYTEPRDLTSIIQEVVYDGEQPSDSKNVSARPPHPLDFTSIEELFSGRRFLAFQNYCMRKNIKNFSELTLDAVEDFQHEKGVGITKYNLVYEYYMNYVNEVPGSSTAGNEKTVIVVNEFEYFQQNPLRNLLERNNLHYLSFIDSFYEEVQEISFEEHLRKYKEKVQRLVDEENHAQLMEKGRIYAKKIKEHSLYAFFEQFKWSHCVKLLKLEYLELESDSYFFEVLQDESFFDSLDQIYAQLEKYVPIRKKLDVLKDEIKERDLLVLKMRSENNSLEVVGQEIGVTRERVRQVEKKIGGRIHRFFASNRFEVILRHFLAAAPQINLDELYSLVGLDKEHGIYVRYYLKGNELFSIIDGSIVDKEFKQYIDQIVEEIRQTTQDDIWQVEEIVHEFQQSDDYEVTDTFIDDLMKRLNYYRKNNIYIKKTIKLPALIRYLFKHKIQGPMEMTDENFEKIQHLMKETFSLQFENGKRAAIARIRDTENVILVNGNTFMYADLNEVPRELINEISNKLEIVLAETDMTTAMTFFLNYEEMWRAFDIQTHYHLYSIINYFFKDDYEIGQGNTLSIRVIGGEITDLYSMLHHYLENHGVSSKKQIMADLKWLHYKLEQLVIRHPEFHQIELDDGSIGVKLFSSYQFTKEELAKVKAYYLNYIDKGYVFLQDLMIEMEFEDELSELLANKGIVKLYDFASLIKYLDPDLRGFHQFLFKKDSHYKQLELVIADEFPNVFIRKELENYYVDKGYALSGLTSLLASLVEKDLFYPYTSYQYINAKAVVIDEQLLAALNAYLEEVFRTVEYVSALDLTGYSSLPKFGECEWTPHLIAHIAPMLGYITINTTRDYRYNKLIILPAHVGIKTYDQLTYKLIKDEYEGNYHESDIANFLMHKRLSHSPKIGIELRESDLFEFRELGFITLKGD